MFPIHAVQSYQSILPSHAGERALMEMKDYWMIVEYSNLTFDFETDLLKCIFF
jgi:hypothetical protein